MYSYDDVYYRQMGDSVYTSRLAGPSPSCEVQYLLDKGTDFSHVDNVSTYEMITVVFTHLNYSYIFYYKHLNICP